jgi:4-aminobutyrate aminotransferase-like enzyme
MRVPPAGFLTLLRDAADSHGALLILDEILTGFGRTGAWFACEHENVIPDLICLGKALTGGFPLSACVGRADLVESAWPKTSGEAIHTSTYLGHPVGCAMAIAQIREMARLNLPERSRVQGNALLRRLEGLDARHRHLKLEVRGKGLMIGLELRSKHGLPATDLTWKVVLGMKEQGFLVIPEGEHGEVIGITPPLIIDRRCIDRAARAFERVIAATAAH